MSEAWQDEAVREQFKVLNSLETIQKDLNTGDISLVINEVDTIVKNHLRVKEASNYCLEARYISDEIIKVSNGKVKFGFIVIVTDQRVKGLLSKIPIFLIQCGQNNVFIDMSCFSFKSWDSFLQKHCGKVLPPGNFCFPENGQYLDGKILKINFAKTQTFSIRKSILGKDQLAIGLTIGAFTASFFVNIKSALGTVTNLMPIAEKHLDSFNTSFGRGHVELLRHFLNWKGGHISWLEGSFLIFHSLHKLFQYYEEDMIAITSQIQYKLKNILDYLKKKFPSVFEGLAVPLRLLGHINNNDKCLLGSGYITGLRQNDASASQILKKCENESAFHYQNEKEKSQNEPLDLTPCNKALVCMTSDFAQHEPKQNLSQNECSNFYLILKKMVVDESIERLKLYEKCRVAAGNGININDYNQSLGITGDPEIHFFMEVINHINQSPAIQFFVTSKCKELVEEESVQLIQCSKMQNNEKMGIYKFIGMETGLIPLRKFIKPLKEIFCTDEDNELFDEDKLVVKEEVISRLDTRIALISNKLNVFIRQNLTNEGISQGFLVVIEDE